MTLPASVQAARDGDTIVFRTEALAKTMQRPAAPNFSEEPIGDCETCKKPFEEVFITTGGPLADPEVFRDLPVAVDGWMCIDCGTFRYPRRIDPAQVHAWMDEGTQHGRAGRFADAELCFLRVTWNWPGYPIAHVNYAEATRSRLSKTGDTLDDATRTRLKRRMLDAYDDAVVGHGERPMPGSAPVVAHACKAGAQLAIDDELWDRARRFLTQLLVLDGASPADVELGTRMLEHVHARDARCAT
ncbi:MAG: hypothetical protein JST00_39475 [Deltaproteobacteria bacterium]|nr:hypothetical protein [Deltaproteobacteria bacterium]